MTRLNWDVFSKKLGTWADKIYPFFLDGGMDTIYETLKTESKLGIRIVPNSEDVFRCFRKTPIEELKTVVMGFCPYHTIKNGEPVADGLMTSCSRTGILQPSLEQLYLAWEEEFNDGLCLNCDRNPDLLYLAKQGILLFNSALTTRAGEAGAHQELWEPFTKYVMQEIIGVEGCPVLMLGKDAAIFEGYLGITQWSYCLPHPVSASYKKEKWDSKGKFKEISDVVRGANGYELHWLLPMEAPF